MNSLAIFGIFAVALLYIAFMFLLPVLSRSNYETRNTGKPLNKRLYRQKQDELDADLKSGEIEQSEYDEAVLELKKRLLADNQDDGLTGAATAQGKRYHYLIAMLALLPAMVVILYWWLGDPESMRQKSAHPSFSHGSKAAKPDAQPSALNARKQQTLKLIGKLEQRLEKNPNETRTLIFLARAYQSLGMFRKATVIYKRLMPTHKNDPDILTAYADALAVVHGGSFSGQALQLVQQALKVNPQHIKALHLAGTAYYRKSDYKQALVYWQRLIKQLPENSAYAKTIRSVLAETERRIHKGVAKKTAGTENRKKPTAKAGAEIKGRVMLDPSLKSSVKPTDTVFIFARAVNGSRMPLAVMKTQAGNLPYQFVLNNKSAMSNLRAGTKVIVIARITKSGSVKKQAGDLVGTSGVHTVGDSKPVLITINKKR